MPSSQSTHSKDRDEEFTVSVDTGHGRHTFRHVTAVFIEDGVLRIGYGPEPRRTKAMYREWKSWKVVPDATP